MIKVMAHFTLLAGFIRHQCCFLGDVLKRDVPSYAFVSMKYHPLISLAFVKEVVWQGQCGLHGFVDFKQFCI